MPAYLRGSYRCHISHCLSPAVDEYHFWQDGQERIWILCDEHLTLAIEMVECVGEVIEKGGVDAS